MPSDHTSQLRLRPSVKHQPLRSLFDPSIQHSSWQSRPWTIIYHWVRTRSQMVRGPITNRAKGLRTLSESLKGQVVSRTKWGNVFSGLTYCCWNAHWDYLHRSEKWPDNKSNNNETHYYYFPLFLLPYTLFPFFPTFLTELPDPFLTLFRGKNQHQQQIWFHVTNTPLFSSKARTKQRTE